MYINLVNTLSIAKFVYESGYLNKMHTHDFFHLIFVLGGKAILDAPSGSTMIQENQLLLFPPHIHHGFTCDKTERLTTLEVKFMINSQDFFSKVSDLPYLLNIRSDEIKKLLENSIHEASNKSYLHIDIVNANVFFILLNLLKSFTESNEVDRTRIRNFDIISEKTMKRIRSENNIDFKDLVSHIEKNYKNPITLEGLSKLVGLNSTYLCHLFKETYGISPIQYINNLRLQKAKEMLLYTNLSITKIAEASGFQTIHYFSRFFKNKENMTPAQFKAKNATSILIKLEGNYLENV